MLRRLRPATLAGLGLVVLVLAMSSYGFSAASAQTTVKPKYRLSVSVSGVPSTAHLNQQYNYTMTIKNTGKKAIPKVMVSVANARYLVPGSTSLKCNIIRDTDASSRCIFSISNLKAGATSRLTMGFLYNDSKKFWGGTDAAISYMIRGGKSICPNTTCPGTVVQTEGRKLAYF